MFNLIAKSLAHPVTPPGSAGATAPTAGPASSAEGSGQTPRIFQDAWSGTMFPIDIGGSNPKGSGGTSGRTNNRKGSVSL